MFGRGDEVGQWWNSVCLGEGITEMRVVSGGTLGEGE